MRGLFGQTQVNVQFKAQRIDCNIWLEKFDCKISCHMECKDGGNMDCSRSLALFLVWSSALNVVSIPRFAQR